MSTDKRPPQQKQDLTDDEADRLIYEAVCQEGRFVPQSPEEVAEAEADLDESLVELPPGLRDPLAILRGKTPPRSVLRLPPPIDRSVVEHLACAARNEGEIPPEVQKSMDEDEERVERENGEK